MRRITMNKVEKMKKTRMDIFQDALALIHNKKYLDAIPILDSITDKTDTDLQIDILFNLGICHWKTGNIAVAKKLFTETLKLEPREIDAKNILAKLSREYPVHFKEPDFQKDGVIIDANFIIEYYKKYAAKLQKLIMKIRTRFNLYTSVQVYREISKKEFEQFYPVFESSIIKIDVPKAEIKQLDTLILKQFEKGTEIKERHIDRIEAWENDLSLVCTLEKVKNPIKYIVTDDFGIQHIVRFIYSDKNPYYYIRSCEDFITSANCLCETNTKTVWEKNIYNIN